MPPEVRGTALELVERFAIAGSYKNILTMQPAKQLSSHPERGESSGGQQVQADHLRPAALLGDAPALFRRALLGYPLNW